MTAEDAMELIQGKTISKGGVWIEIIEKLWVKTLQMMTNDAAREKAVNWIVWECPYLPDVANAMEKYQESIPPPPVKRYTDAEIRAVLDGRETPDTVGTLP